MKRPVVIALFLLVALAACHQPKAPEVHQGAEGPPPLPTPFPELVAVDSLTWELPDSAFVLLLPYFDTVHANETFDNHYAHLLLSELLYKNDCAQTNREELQQAAAYFDSLVAVCYADTRGLFLRGLAGRDVPCASANATVFLAARAHYINGVGCYERDSIMLACQEYILALEIMEEYFDEKELVGKKARLMALAYTHLTGLFSDQYLHEQAIYFGKEALGYYEKHDAVPWHKAWMLNKIGSHYDMMDALDSAELYYQKAASVLDDTTLLMYRDVSTHLAYLSYKKDKDVQGSVNHLHRLLKDAESEKEYLARCLTIGEVFYHEKQLDSAHVYLDRVFHHTPSVGSRKQAAEWLIDICQAQGRDSEILEYATFLVPFANQNENQSHLKSQLTKIFHDYGRERLEIAHRKQLRKLGKYAGAALALLATLAAVFVVFHFVHKRRHKHLRLQKEAVEKQLETERYAHEIQQKALAGRLKRSNETLKEHRKPERKTSSAGEKQVTEEFPCSFAEEPVCRHILSVCNDAQKPIKSIVPVSAYADIALTPEQKAQLTKAAKRHYGPLFEKLKQQYPTLKEKDWLYCCLCLLDLNNVQIAVLLQKSNSTVWEREKRLQKIFGSNDKVSIILRGFIAN